MINLSNELKEAMSQPLETTGRIQLPFASVNCFTLNGDNAWKQSDPARYFGGWSIRAENWISETIPAEWKESEFAPKDGDPYQILAARTVYVAWITTRIRSVNKTTKEEFAGFHKGASPQVNALCYLFTKNGNGFTPEFPVVLCAGGYQAGHVLDSLKKWETVTAKVRRQMGQNPVSFFICKIGTLRDKPFKRDTGTGDKNIPITPMELFVPETIDEELLTKLFVGEEIANAMADLKAQAREWLDDWNKPKSAPKQTTVNKLSDEISFDDLDSEGQPEPEITF